jgi:hypothetical protein
MNKKMVLALCGVALIAAALVGVSAAQYGNSQNPVLTYRQTGTNCINAATGGPVCLNNGTCTNTYCNNTCTTGYCNQTCSGYCFNNTATGNCQNQNQNEYCNGYGYAEQNQNAYGCGTGIMGRNSSGRSCHP